MIELKRIFPECNADTMLAELILQRGKPAHYKGISKVCNALINFDGAKFTIGIVDTDKFKRDAGLIHKFSEEVENKMNPEGLLIKKIPSSNKYVIRLDPGFEKWIWQQAEVCSISPRDYGFNSVEDLMKAAKQNEVAEHRELKGFVNAVVQANPPAIQTMRKWLGKVLET